MASNQLYNIQGFDTLLPIALLFQFENSGDASLRSNTSTEDILDTTLGADVDPGFRRINTTCAILVLLFFIVCMEVGRPRTLEAL